MQCNVNMLPPSHYGTWHRANFRSFNVHPKRKKCKKNKNKTTTDPNPTAMYPNLNPTIHKAAKRKGTK